MLDPNDPHNVMSMSPCIGDRGTIYSGQTVRLHSQYSASHPLEDVMGIMLMYVRPQ